MLDWRQMSESDNSNVESKWQNWTNGEGRNHNLFRNVAFSKLIISRASDWCRHEVNSSTTDRLRTGSEKRGTLHLSPFGSRKKKKKKNNTFFKSSSRRQRRHKCPPSAFQIHVSPPHPTPSQRYLNILRGQTITMTVNGGLPENSLTRAMTLMENLNKDPGP